MSGIFSSAYLRKAFYADSFVPQNSQSYAALFIRILLSRRSLRVTQSFLCGFFCPADLAELRSAFILCFFLTDLFCDILRFLRDIFFLSDLFCDFCGIYFSYQICSAVFSEFSGIYFYQLVLRYSASSAGYIFTNLFCVILRVQRDIFLPTCSTIFSEFSGIYFSYQICSALFCDQVFFLSALHYLYLHFLLFY